MTGIPGVGRRRDSRRDAGHDLERDPGPLERLGLLASTPEHERVAALEPDDRLALQAVVDQHALDLGLSGGLTISSLAGVDQLGIRPGALERLWRDQAIVDDHVGLGDQLERPPGEQSGIAGSGADEVHAP